MKKILITSGGSAGHALPAIEIAKSFLKNHRVKLLYVGSKNGPEKDLAKEANIPYKGIITGKRRAYFSIENFIDLFKIFFGLIQSFFIFCIFRPDIVFAKGGYVSYPVIVWTKFFSKTLIIHESDIVMGKANLTAIKYARKICLGFPIKYFMQYNKLSIPLEKLVYTGIPLRKEFEKLKSEVRHKNTKPKIVITGGSQGSANINKVISEILPELLKQFEIFHVSGSVDYPLLKEKYKNHSNYHVYNFSDTLPYLLSQADLVITRAGANTLSEISCLGKPSIIIPLDNSAQNHQNINAKVYQECSAAVVVTEKNLTSSSLLSIINRLMEDSDLRILLGHHAQEFYVKNATSIISDLIYEEK